jgi:hypothetical protein
MQVRHSGATLGLALALVGSEGSAQRSDPCFTAPLDGQKLQKDGRLLEARVRFSACARNTCPVEIVTDCARWARDVDEALPSVVVAARDSHGRDLVDAQVSIDGQPPFDLSARAIPLDPGPHRFVFMRTGDADIEQNVLLREGEKNREISATFGAATTSPAAPPPAAVAVPSPPASALTEIPSRVDAAQRPVPSSTWVVGGIGVAGLASFATFASLGIRQRASDGCASGCTQSQNDSVELKFHFADASLGVAVVALGVATGIYLARPARVAAGTGAGRESLEFGFDVRPMPGGGVAVVGGLF